MAANGIRGAIAVDAMGGDLGVAEVVRAVQLAFENLPGLGKIVLVGKERLLTRLIKAAKLDGEERLSVHHASEVISMDEKPIRSIKQKKDASIIKAVELVKNDVCQAVVSCGNTGSLMACGTLKLRPMEGVERPALATIMPSKVQHFILLDVGANTTPKPEHLVHNAILGSHYARIVLGRKKPRVGLLSIGTEEIKGTGLVQDTHALLKKIKPLVNYHGLIEGFQVFNNEVDVVVCDGFTGNVVLKICESLFFSLKGYLKEEIRKTPFRMAGAFLSKGAYKNMQNQLNPERYGGAPLLGLRGNILKAHGSSNQYALMNAIRIASEIIAHNMNAEALADITEANSILKNVSNNE